MGIKALQLHPVENVFPATGQVIIEQNGVAFIVVYIKQHGAVTFIRRFKTIQVAPPDNGADAFVCLYSFVAEL